MSDGDAVTVVNFTNKETAPETAPRQLPIVVNNCITQLKAYFEGELKEFNLPLLPDGTEFQQKVWQLLRQIPYGKQVSYRDVTKWYGDIKAIRAVASANGKNRIAIIIPCHRVIGTDHSLTGYAGGLWRKKWLLELEAKVSGGVQTLF
jgi:methylated-DNA-[protein]-cysteine S-methyltransferase